MLCRDENGYMKSNSWGLNGSPKIPVQYNPGENRGNWEHKTWNAAQYFNWFTTYPQIVIGTFIGNGAPEGPTRRSSYALGNELGASTPSKDGSFRRRDILLRYEIFPGRIWSGIVQEIVRRYKRCRYEIVHCVHFLFSDTSFTPTRAEFWAAPNVEYRNNTAKFVCKCQE